MAELLEFFVPTKAQDLECEEKQELDHFVIETACDFDVPPEQQLDDLTRLFDALHREKSPTALFTKPELFYPLFSYVKALQDRELNSDVTRASRHKICHEIGERMKKLLQVTLAFIKKQKTTEKTESKALVVCLRSTLKMYAFILCGVLSSSAPTEDEEGAALSQHRANKKRKRREAIGFGDDNSGVDMDGRELALNSLVELCSKEVMYIWPNEVLEHGLLNVMLSMSLHMITQKANIGDDAQSISSSLALLLARVTSCMLFKNANIDPADLVSPMIELAMKSDCAATFLSKLVSDIEQEESVSDQSQALLESLFKGMSHAALDDAPNDNVAAKNISLFFSEVAKKSVSATVKMCDFILPVLQSENYDIRKAIITCIAEMIVQRYTGLSRSSSDDAARNQYLNELLFRIMDINPFVRNHILHIWERLVDIKAVPKRYHLALTEALVGRLEDRNYLVRDAAMATISSILRRNWFGQVLNAELVSEKLLECTEEARPVLNGVCSVEDALNTMRSQFQPVEEEGEDPLSGEEPAEPRAELNLSEEQMTVVNRVLFYENTLIFIAHIKKALQYAVQLLDSRTDRDVIEAIKLIVACSEYRLEAGDKAFLKVLVMAFEGEMKIQLAVRDAFVEVIFVSLGRLSGSPMTRATASAQKLIAILKMASEGEVSAVERIFFLLKSNPAFSRHISGHFIDAVWGIAEGSVDQEASIEDRRTAMRVYSLLSKFFWKDLRTRKESILDFLVSDSIKDNTVISYVFTALEQQALDPQFVPIAASVDPTAHPELKHLVTHLCRSTTAVASWMRLAQAAVNAIHHLCELPVVLFTYVLQYLGDRIQLHNDPNAKTQLFFLVGITALKQLVSVETTERVQIKSLEDAPNVQSNNGNASRGGDSMHKELGFGSQECQRHAIQELAQKRKQAIVTEGSIWFQFACVVVETCRQKPMAQTTENPYERIAAVMALCYLMIVNEEFCSQNLNLLFSLVANKKELWVIKTNIVIALGDLACVHPNLLGPYLNVPTTGFFKLLVDDDVRVRAVTIQVCSHLVLGEMLRIRDHLYTIVKLVADPDETIASNAVTFVQNLAMKEKEKTGNLIPPLVTELSAVMPSDKFQLAMRSLLERVEGDKPTVSLIDRLCRRFKPYFEKNKKRLQLALNIVFCLGELSYSTEGPTKQIMSEACYQQYKDWLRNPDVLECFKAIAAKAKRAGRAGAERRDKTALEEWEARMMADSCSQNEAERPEEVDTAA
ncbi:condensin complex subunit 1 [Strigomonas culicis]|uniref:Condensin complex subunit 1 n=1 Tax=Strigomonas culicis TaxID=28005 RepID=S9TVF0_9TRYP|nr:condensin complex subunit 1 [Strigomonas culicis]EPY23114.1 condensin complex subunit 1 [Strigomonas culicis]|eukprot:EPY20534.1 condensin complex subunit 1 [Strigomonas culicis]